LEPRECAFAVGAGPRESVEGAEAQVPHAYTVNLHRTKGSDGLSVVLVVEGKKVDSGRISSSSCVVAISYASS
jgi:hypothetical protein